MPESAFPNQWVHIGAHLTLGMVAASLIGWGFASLVMLVTRKVARQPVAAGPDRAAAVWPHARMMV